MADEEEYVEPHIVQGLLPPEPQSKKKCEKCRYFERSLTSPPCWDCYPSEDKKEWKKNGHKDRDSEPEQMDREDGRDGSPCLQ